jgi:hypothetical protein
VLVKRQCRVSDRSSTSRDDRRTARPARCTCRSCTPASAVVTRPSSPHSASPQVSTRVFVIVCPSSAEVRSGAPESWIKHQVRTQEGCSAPGVLRDRPLFNLRGGVTGLCGSGIGVSSCRGATFGRSCSRQETHDPFRRSRCTACRRTPIPSSPVRACRVGCCPDSGRICMAVWRVGRMSCSS